MIMKLALPTMIPCLYKQLRWCPGGLAHTQKRKQLQWLCVKEKREQELERQMDDFFNKIGRMVHPSEAMKIEY
jgi:hypothetical protein